VFSLIRFILALLIAAAMVAPAAADDQKVRVRGTIASVTPTTLAVTTAGGSTVDLPITPTTRVGYVVKSDLSALKPGMAVGCTAVPGPDGVLRAREVHIFPANATPSLGVSPWDTEPGATMTNATLTTIGDAKVDNVAGHQLTLTLPSGGGDKQILIGPNVPIVASAPADHAALVAGAHVTINAVKHDDGTLTVSAINVGQNGLVPPM
jgi:hypothetical protein